MEGLWARRGRGLPASLGEPIGETPLCGAGEVDAAVLSSAKEKELFARFEHSISDHLPLWVRLPLPT